MNRGGEGIWFLSREVRTLLFLKPSVRKSFNVCWDIIWAVRGIVGEDIWVSIGMTF